MPRRSGAATAKARRPSIHDLSHAELTDEEMLGWQREMSGGTDRACVLVGAALLDQKLGECLVAHMRADLTTDEVAQLFSRENSPLSSLSSKTALAHSLEILDREQRDQLDTIRRIRNAFAHSKEPRPPPSTDIARLPKAHERSKHGPRRLGGTRSVRAVHTRSDDRLCRTTPSCFGGACEPAAGCH